MDPNKLTEMDPMPIWSPAPSDHGAQRSRSPFVPPSGFNGDGFQSHPPEGVALRLGPEAQIPDHPGSAVSFGRPASQPVPPPQTFAPPPTGAVPYLQEYETPDIRTLRQSCQINMREYLAMQHEYRQYGGNVSEQQMRSQTGRVLSDLMNLQMEVRELAREAQNHRWRRWLMGGIL